MRFLVALAGITVPLMLFVDPIWQSRKQHAKVAEQEEVGGD